ncbi:MAG: hypothetical protein U0452_12135 [Anaerolineae bacterium]
MNIGGVIAVLLGFVILGAPSWGVVPPFSSIPSIFNSTETSTLGSLRTGVNANARGDTMTPGVVALDESPCSCITQDGIDYLLRDKFTTPESPLADGPASEYGMRDVTGSLWTAVDGRLRDGVQLDNAVWGQSAIVYEGLSRSGGRTLWALVTPQDGESELFFGWQTTATAGDPTTNGYGFLVESASIFATEPGAQVPLLTEGKPGHAQQYLMGITLNEGQGAIYWISTLETQTSANEWTIPKFPDARIVWASTAGTDTTLYPTVSALGGFTYPGGHAIEDIRVADIAEWMGEDGLATQSDRFNRRDNSSEIGGDWAAPDAGMWGVRNNQAYTSSAASNGRVYEPDGPTNGLMVGDVTTGSSLTNAFGLLARRTDGANWMNLYNDGSANISLETWANNAYDSTVFSTDVEWSPSTTYRWVLGFQDNQYRFWSDGVSPNANTPVIDSSNRDAGATGFGLFGNDAESSYDNWAVYPAIITLPEIPFGSAYGAVPQIFTTGAVVSSDTFTDPDGTSLTSHKPDIGGAWSLSNGDWSINASNQVATTTTSENNFAYVNSNGPDYEASVDLVTPSALTVGQIRQGLVVRWTDENNFVVIRALMDDASQLDNDEIEVQEFINGSGAVVHKTYLGNLWEPNTSYTMKAQVVGDVLNVFLNGVPYLTVYLSNPALLTGHGVGLYREDGTDELLFDNFTVKPIGAVDSTATVGD